MQYAGSLNGAGDKLILANPTAMTKRILEPIGLVTHPAIVIASTRHDRVAPAALRLLSALSRGARNAG